MKNIEQNSIEWDSNSFYKYFFKSKIINHSIVFIINIGVSVYLYFDLIMGNTNSRDYPLNILIFFFIIFLVYASIYSIFRNRHYKVNKEGISVANKFFPWHSVSGCNKINLKSFNKVQYNIYFNNNPFAKIGFNRYEKIIVPKLLYQDVKIFFEAYIESKKFKNGKIIESKSRRFIVIFDIIVVTVILILLSYFNFL